MIFYGEKTKNEVAGLACDLVFRVYKFLNDFLLLQPFI